MPPNRMLNSGISAFVVWIAMVAPITRVMTPQTLEHGFAHFLGEPIAEQCPERPSGDYGCDIDERTGDHVERIAENEDWGKLGFLEPDIKWWRCTGQCTYRRCHHFYETLRDSLVPFFVNQNRDEETCRP